MLAVPILIQVYFNAGLSYFLNRMLGVELCVAGPSALIGASNLFELAVAIAMCRRRPGSLQSPRNITLTSERTWRTPARAKAAWP